MFIHRNSVPFVADGTLIKYMHVAWCGLNLITDIHLAQFFPYFLDKENILILIDTNYTQPLQQRNTIMTVRMHTTKKKERERTKKKVPLRYSSPSSNNTSTTKTTPELQALRKRRLQEGTVHKRCRCPIIDLRFSP